MDIVFRAAIMFVFLSVLVRALGKRELAEISAFELLLLVIVGDIVQQGITQEDMSVTGGILAAGTMALLALATSYLGFRFKPAARLLDGVAVVVVRDGAVIDEALRIERITRDELLEQMRQRGISSLAEIDLGIIEADGRFSFITKSKPASQPSA